MPHVNGFRLALMGKLVWPDTPMILLSETDASLSDEPHRREAYAGLQKPYIFGELLELMKDAIQFTRERRSRASQSIMLRYQPSAKSSRPDGSNPGHSAHITAVRR